MKETQEYIINKRTVDKYLISHEGSKNNKVLYWMHSAQRVEYNYSLYKAIKLANAKKCDIEVVFIISEKFKWGNERNYKFMIDGLRQLNEKFKDKGIPFLVEIGDIYEIVKKNLNSGDTLIMDKSYISYIKQVTQKEVKSYCKKNEISFFEIDNNTVVPINMASSKLEYSARTIRPKINAQLNFFLKTLKMPAPFKRNNEYKNNVLDKLSDKEIFEKCFFDSNVKPVDEIKGGYEEALKKVDVFAKENIKKYNDDSPENQKTSKLSMYLHFGQISPVEIIQIIRKSNNDKNSKVKENIDNFIEQLVIRRELAYNFTEYLKEHDRFDKITYDWAYSTMKKHENDNREYLYELNDYINFKTHDKYFNAAMKEMVYTGYMHNYMRMYWAKKIIEWSSSYKKAYETILDLNNTYFIDGRDPVSYASIAWCFGRHDRAWKERPIFGKIRYMNESGLKRKFDIEKYVERMEKLTN